MVVHRARIDFDNLQSERKYDRLDATYSQSKLADLIFAIELQRRLSGAGSTIISTSARPGLAITNIFANATGFFRIFLSVLTRLLAQDAALGALPTLFAATSPDVEPGGYYGPNGSSERKGYPAPARIPSAATDEAVAKRLWAETERLTGTVFAPLSQATTD